MKVGLVIGTLSRGGAERQFVELALGLAHRGHTVELAAYGGAGTLDHELLDRGVVVHRMAEASRLGKIRAVRTWLDGFDPQVVHASMKRASTLAILASWPPSRRAVVVNDMSTASYRPNDPALRAALQVYRLADAVTTETEENQRSIISLAPWLEAKTIVIRNGVDVDRFQPRVADRSEAFRLVCVGRVCEVKNAERVVQALHLAAARSSVPVRLDWYGRTADRAGRPEPEFERAMAVVERCALHDVVRFHGEVDDVHRAYAGADALVHAAVQEGIPNALVEGMSCGLPVVVGSISDLPMLVASARNGFVCNSKDASSIADAIVRMVTLPAAERQCMGERSRAIAATWFGRDRYITEHEELYRRVSR